MPALTMDQVQQLNSYSIYTTEPKRTLFTLADIHKDFYHPDFLNLMMGITDAATETAAGRTSATGRSGDRSRTRSRGNGYVRNSRKPL